MDYLSSLFIFPNLLLLISFVIMIITRTIQIINLYKRKSIEKSIFQMSVSVIVSSVLLTSYGFVEYSLQLISFGLIHMLFSLIIVIMYIAYDFIPNLPK